MNEDIFKKDLILSLILENIISNKEIKTLSRSLRYKFGNKSFQVYYQHARKKNVDSIFNMEHDELYIFKSAKTRQILIIGLFKFCNIKKRVYLKNHNWEDIQIISKVLNNECSNITKARLKRLCRLNVKNSNCSKSKLIESIRKNYKPKFQYNY